MTKEITDFEERLSNLSSNQLNKLIMSLSLLKKNAELAEKAAKKYWASIHVGGEKENLTSQGVIVGDISLTKGNAKMRYTVKDTHAYAIFLKKRNYVLEDGSDSWGSVEMPKEEACKSEYIESIIRSRGGELPDGIEPAATRGETVKVVCPNDTPIDLSLIFKNVPMQIEGKK